MEYKCSICGTSYYSPHLLKKDATAEEISVVDPPHLSEGEKGKLYCNDCINREHLIKCSHSNCNKYLTKDEIILSGSGYLCNQHWNNSYTHCSECGVTIRRRYAYDEPISGKRLCHFCFEKSYFKCQDCGDIQPLKNKLDLELNGHMLIICKKCRKEHYEECNECHKLNYKRNLKSVKLEKDNLVLKKIYLCNECLNKIAFKCDNCGHWYSKDTYLIDETLDIYMCPNCGAVYNNKTFETYDNKNEFNFQLFLSVMKDRKSAS